MCDSVARFTRRARLLSPGQFKRVFESGRRFRSARLTAVVAQSETQQPRLGLAIARKALPKSVDRNRVKRLARESFRLAQASLPACDVVLMAAAGAAKTENAGLRAELDSIWMRLRERWPGS